MKGHAPLYPPAAAQHTPKPEPSSSGGQPFPGPTSYRGSHQAYFASQQPSAPQFASPSRCVVRPLRLRLCCARLCVMAQRGTATALAMPHGALADACLQDTQQLKGGCVSVSIQYTCSVCRCSPHPTPGTPLFALCTPVGPAPMSGRAQSGGAPRRFCRNSTARLTNPLTGCCLVGGLGS